MKYLFLLFFCYGLVSGPFQSKAQRVKKQEKKKQKIQMKLADKFGKDYADGTAEAEGLINVIRILLQNRKYENDLYFMDFSNRHNLYTLDEIVKILKGKSYNQIRAVLVTLAGDNYQKLSFYYQNPSYWNDVHYQNMIDNQQYYDDYITMDEWRKKFLNNTVEYNRCVKSIVEMLTYSDFELEMDILEWVKKMDSKGYNLKELEECLVRLFNSLFNISNEVKRNLESLVEKEYSDHSNSLISQILYDNHNTEIEEFLPARDIIKKLKKKEKIECLSQGSSQDTQEKLSVTESSVEPSSVISTPVISGTKVSSNFVESRGLSSSRDSSTLAA